MRSKTSKPTTGRNSISSVATREPEIGSDAWMISRGFRETTPEEHGKFAKFFEPEPKKPLASDDLLGLF
jgi:hypothetical protein